MIHSLFSSCLSHVTGPSQQVAPCPSLARAHFLVSACLWYPLITEKNILTIHLLQGLLLFEPAICLLGQKYV